MAQCKHVIGKSHRISKMLLNAQIRFMVEQTIKNMRGITNRGTDDLRVKWCVLIGDMGVEQNARLVAILRAHRTR